VLQVVCVAHDSGSCPGVAVHDLLRLPVEVPRKMNLLIDKTIQSESANKVVGRTLQMYITLTLQGTFPDQLEPKANGREAY
jgi:hypothetical protein